MTERERTRDERPEARRRVDRELLGETLDLDREVNRLAAMGEPTRFTILYLLATDGETRSGKLAELLDRQQNDLYHHLNTLEDAGLVGKYRDGSSRVYELSPLGEQLVPGVFESIQSRAGTA
jgi:DNA-binding transcriptional ArsR family regulator